jgi:hypothetical protein
MNTSAFLTALRTQPARALVFRAGGRLTNPGYHLTEVKRVAYETMDCDDQIHRWSETQLELWVPPLAGILPGRGHMPAAKFLAIVDRVESTLPLDGEAQSRIHAAFDGLPAALYDIANVTTAADQLWVELTPDRTRCTADERRVAAATGGCCGTEGEKPGSATADAGCGCEEATPAGQRVTACCA